MTSDLSHDEQLEFARQIALRLLDSRSRSEAELWDRLTSRGVPDEICQELIGRFRDVGLVDDAAFADALTQTCVQVNRYGATRIRAELRRRGVAEDVVAEALGQVGYEEELEAALAFARRRSHRLAGLDPQVARVVLPRLWRAGGSRLPWSHRRWTTYSVKQPPTRTTTPL